MWSELGIAASALAMTAAATKTLVVDTILRSRGDKQTLETAKAQHPKMLEQIDAGNFKTFAEGVVISQSAVVQALTETREDVTRLRNREDALEAEAAGWQKTAQEAIARAEAAEQRAVRAEERADRYEALYERLSRRCDRLEAELRTLKAAP